MLWNIMIYNNCFNIIYSYLIYSCDGRAEFPAAIIPVFRKFKRTAFIYNRIYCNIKKYIFTDTFGQFNTSLLNKIIHFI